MHIKMWESEAQQKTLKSHRQILAFPNFESEEFVVCVWYFCV